MNKHICPVCRQRATRTLRDNIWAHMDTAGRSCEGSGEPFRITERVSAREAVSA